LRRRERVIRIFPNETSMIRLMGSVLMEMHERWMTDKKPGKLCNSTVTN
jgi:transposase-like protein